MLPVAILAGGLATRLGSHTETVPKSLLEVAGRPFAEHQLTLLRARGIERVVFCVGHLGEQIRETIGDGGRFGLDVSYSFDGERLLGTGGALRRARPILGEAFFVLYGDSYLDCDYAAVEAAFLAAGRPALMTVFRNEGRWDASNVLFADGRIVRYDKRAASAMQHIDYGLGAIEARVFDPYEPAEPLDLATVYADLLARDELAGFEVPTRFYEIGSPSGLAETRQHLGVRPSSA
jgi:N-acetyl-alpha-D-muramate 1-phosphate uridylyltransferase